MAFQLWTAGAKSVEFLVVAWIRQTGLRVSGSGCRVSGVGSRV